MTMSTRLLAAVALVLAFAMPSSAQSSDELTALRREMEALKQSQLAIQKELQEIKSLLLQRLQPPGSAQPAGSAQPPMRDIVVETAGAPVKGRADARVTLVEFSDYQCPFCGRYVRDTQAQIERDYVATGKVKYVFRDFPIESLHKQALKAHEAAKCAGEQEQYWPMHDRLFANQQALDGPALAAHAGELHLDSPRFQQCLDGGKHAAAIRKSIADAQAAGITATPTFMLGITEPGKGTVKILKIVRGAQPYARFKEAIDSLLAPATP
jgi:protein-disulfide isomerase